MIPAAGHLWPEEHADEFVQLITDWVTASGGS
jgi:hypothetical protein